MNGENTWKLWCLLNGDSLPPFGVTVAISVDIDDLKKVIWSEKRNHLRDFDASSLSLWQLNELEPVKPEATLAQRIASRGSDIATFATKLTVTRKVSTLFRRDPPEDPPEDHVHILVQLPTNSRPLNPSFPSIPSPPPNASPREDTVAALYQRLMKYSFIQVRGTPASGKTVLAQLLADHISRQDPNVHIVWVYGWPSKPSENYRSYLKQQGWDEREKTVFIFDEAQLSYQDAGLWADFFKSMHDYENRRAIIFASYGSPTSDSDFEITGPVPMFILDHQRVTLRHVTHEDDLPPVGLLFTRSEFNDLVMKHYPSSDYCFHSCFFDAVFDITSGHVGAIRDFISIIIADDSYRKLEHTTGQPYTWNSFLAEVSPQELLRKLENYASIFKKGLPSNKELQDPTTASIFSTVLRNNFVMDADFRTEDENSAVQRCFQKGWLHTDKLGVIDLPDDVGFFFASPLHRWYVEWKLLDSLPPTKFQANSLVDFVIDVIRLFSPRLLSAERRIGPSCIQRLPEAQTAQYQDEMYRCCHICSKGSLVTFPEFGTAKGRGAFYIPAKSWGIELLCDGDQLATHCGRFSTPGSYKTALPLSEHIIVDCRTTHPKEDHPYMSNLYHVVFEDNFENVCILDNKLCLVSGGKFRLLESP